MINNVTLVGRLTKDPELSYTPQGVAVGSFTLAVNRPFTNAQGEREADFIRVVVWRRQAENSANFLGKGSLAGVTGAIQTRQYDDNSGQRQFVTEVRAESVQFLEPKNSNKNNNNNQDSGGYGGSGNKTGDDPFATEGKPIDISDDELPF